MDVQLQHVTHLLHISMNRNPRVVCVWQNQDGFICSDADLGNRHLKSMYCWLIGIYRCILIIYYVNGTWKEFPRDQLTDWHPMTLQDDFPELVTIWRRVKWTCCTSKETGVSLEISLNAPLRSVIQTIRLVHFRASQSKSVSSHQARTTGGFLVHCTGAVCVGHQARSQMKHCAPATQWWCRWCFIIGAH